MRVARVGFGAVVLAAGVSGAALLVVPDRTGDYFSWELGPPSLASLIGGLYVASSVVFGIALTLPWRRARSLVAAAVALTTPTFVATMVHVEVFDLGRWQAWFWILLFGGAPLFWAGLLVANRAATESGRKGPRSPGTMGLAAFALVLAAGAVVVWIDPVRAGGPMPFDLSPMGGRFAGAWLAFFAEMVAWAAFRPDEALFPYVALAVYAFGALIAGLRSITEMESSASRYVYLAVLLLGCLVFAAAARRHAIGEHRTGGR